MRRILELVLFLLAGGLADSAQSAVFVSVDSGIATPNLLGFRTFTLSAGSTVPGETISTVDLIGDPAVSNSSSPAWRGISVFGQMNQVNPLGQPTVFTNLNPFFSFDGADPLQDSQFMYNSATEVNSPAGFALEGSSFLRALFYRDVPLGQSIQFAQLVLPYPHIPDFRVRGLFGVNRGGVIVNEPVDSTFFFEAPLIADDTDLGNRAVGSMIDHVFTVSSSAGAVTWSNLVVNGPGVPSIAPTLGPNGAFHWDSANSLRGLYTFNATVTDFLGSVVGRMTVNLIPEPATLSFALLAMLGWCGFIRRSR